MIHIHIWVLWFIIADGLFTGFGIGWGIRAAYYK